MTSKTYPIGTRGYIGEGTQKRLMEVYEATSYDGTKYLSLRSIDGTEYNGKLEDYQDGFWGGPFIPITKEL